MSLNQSKWCVAGGAALLFTCATVAGAQTYQGALRGVVRDIQGVIPGAEVTLVNEDTNSQRTAVTNEVGEYVVASVLPGPAYRARVAPWLQDRAANRISHRHAADGGARLHARSGGDLRAADRDR